LEFLHDTHYLLVAVFFLVAFIYSSVGMGGGSSYTALMAIFGFNPLAIPMISLTLNLFVSSVGSFNFIRNKHAQLKLVLPFLISSIPMAYLGGALQLPKEIFYWVLLVSLVFVALRIFVWQNTTLQLDLGDRQKLLVSLFAGGLLGLVAGIVGIGGGVYLVPLIIVLGLGTPKQAAACGAIFIWLNSCAGMIARIQHNAIDITDYIPLIIAVVTGGALGSFMGSFRFSPALMEKILGSVILIAIVFLARKLMSM
jgi:uncharacterized membrane protein YfcA